jgi:hypothetical protein
VSNDGLQQPVAGVSLAVGWNLDWSRPLLHMAHKSNLLRVLLLTGVGALAGNTTHAAQITAPEERMAVLGTLTCSLTGQADGVSSGVGRDMLCRFQPGHRGPEETYTGSVQGVGKGELLFGTGAVLLAIKGPASTEVAPGMLTQTYAVDAGASGGAPAPLIGEKNKQIVLQPLAEQEGRVAEGKTQPDAVIIRVELTLQSTPA